MRRSTTIPSAASARKKITGPHVPELHPLTVVGALWYQGKKTDPACSTANTPTPSSPHGLATTGDEGFDGTTGLGNGTSGTAGVTDSHGAGDGSPTATGRAGCSTSDRFISTG